MFNGAFTEILIGLLALILVVAAVIDVRTFTISNGLNLTVALLAPLFWWSAAVPLWPDVATQVAVAGGVFVLLAGAFYAGMMGGGDVKLAAALALWFSPASTVKVPGPDVDRRRSPDAARRRAGTAPKSAKDVLKFHTELRSHSAVSRFSPNGFLTNLPDV